MKVVRDRTISNESIVMDDTELIDCELFDCQLIYRGGDLRMTRTISDRCTWTFEGAALKTIHVLRHLGMIDRDLDKLVAVPPKPPRA